MSNNTREKLLSDRSKLKETRKRISMELDSFPKTQENAEMLNLAFAYGRAVEKLFVVNKRLHKIYQRGKKNDTNPNL